MSDVIVTEVSGTPVEVSEVVGQAIQIKKYSASSTPVKFATFAELQASVDQLEEGQIVYVQDDEGVPNWFGYDGTNINWIISQQV